MSKLIFCMLILHIHVCFSNDPSISAVRLLYRQAATEEHACRELLNILETYNTGNDPLLAGYKASALMLMAKHVFNPLNKWSYFCKGKKMLDAAIDADKNNVELRFLRFAVQTSAPSFLGYCYAVQRDKAFLLSAVHQINDTSLKEWIISFLRNSSFLSARERQDLLSLVPSQSNSYLRLLTCGETISKENELVYGSKKPCLRYIKFPGS